MASTKRIVLTVPDTLLRDLDGLVAMERSQRNALILEAMRIYVAERKRRDMREQLKRGYRSMARVNLALAEEGPLFESGSVSRGGSRGNE